MLISRPNHTFTKNLCLIACSSLSDFSEAYTVILKKSPYLPLEKLEVVLLRFLYGSDLLRDLLDLFHNLTSDI